MKPFSFELVNNFGQPILMSLGGHALSRSTDCEYAPYKMRGVRVQCGMGTPPLPDPSYPIPTIPYHPGE
jgi:hypothetical protein